VYTYILAHELILKTSFDSTLTKSVVVTYNS